MSLMSPGVNTNFDGSYANGRLHKSFALVLALNFFCFPFPSNPRFPRTEYNNDLQSVIPSAVGLSHIVFNPSLRTLFMRGHVVAPSSHHLL